MSDNEEKTACNLWIRDERATIALRREASGETRHEIVEGAEGWRIIRPQCETGATGSLQFWRRFARF